MKTAILAMTMLVIALPVAGQQPTITTGDAEAILNAATRAMVQQYPGNSVVLVHSKDRTVSTVMAGELGLATLDRAVACTEGMQPPACNVSGKTVALRFVPPSIRGDSADIDFGVILPSEHKRKEAPHLQGWRVKLVKADTAWNVVKTELVLET